MFINELDEAGRKSFLELARRMVIADGVATSEEEEMFAALEEESGGTYSETTKNSSLSVLCTQITGGDVRAKSVLELASLAHVDGEFDGAERELLEQVCASWDIDRLTMIRAVDWASRRIQSALEAAEIIGAVCDNTIGD